MQHSPRFGRSAFVCSKPLQFLVCASIVREYKIPSAVIMVVRSSLHDPTGLFAFFSDSDYRRLFDKISLHSSHKDAFDTLRSCRYRSLFVEDDRVSFYFLAAPLKTRYLVVFEEGVGTYHNDFRSRMKGLRRAKWTALSRLSGCGLHFGSGRNTDYVIVQRPELYSLLNRDTARKALPLRPLMTEFQHNRAQWSDALARIGMPTSPRAGRAALILATWGGASQALVRSAAASHDIVYYKPHPHDGILVSTPAVQVVKDSWIPAEALVQHLAKHHKTLTVYHFSSSVYFNCHGHFQNVSFVDVLKRPRLVEVFRWMEALEKATLYSTADPGNSHE